MARPPEFRPTELVRRLSEAKIDFVVVGGVAVVVQGYARYTDDLDIAYSLAAENLERLGALMIDVHAQLRGIDQDLPFAPDARTLRQIQILCLDTDLGGLDLLVEPPGAPRYAELRRRADVVDIEGAEVRIASIRDLISMKRAAGRPLDAADVEALEVARRRRRRRR